MTEPTEPVRWVEFAYREFHDVPRSVVVDSSVGRLLLESRFVQELDEYSDSYEAFVLPATTNLSGSWAELSRSAVRHLGAIRVKDVEFDETRRRALNLASLARLLDQLDSSK